MKILTLFILLFTLQSLNAQLFSPGKLAKPHAYLEGLTNCTQCHEIGEELSDKKCNDCHVEIGFRQKNKKGFHASKEVTEKNCVKCHKDHAGLEYEQVVWEKNKFEHNKTGYKLEGKHEKVKCENCHKKENITDAKIISSKKDLKKTMLGLEEKCLSCHFDEHRKQLKNDCQSCHNFNDWKKNSFDHEKAKFKLTGKHKETDCVKCHEIQKSTDKDKFGKVDTEFQKFIGLKFENCNSCHKDVHDGKFKETCESCHTTAGWKKLKAGNSFDHSKTNYPLLGKHAKIDCEKCHKNGETTKKIEFDKCSRCHEDKHFGDFKNSKSKGECETCHNVNGFTPSIFTVSEHEKTKFPLKGGHLATACIFCHKKIDVSLKTERAKFVFEGIKCSNCHEDKHFGQFREQVVKNDCESCHTETIWQEVTKFDHETSKFKLTNSHREVACEKCHKTVDFGKENERILYKPMDLDCENCHTDIHFGQFKEKNAKFTACEKCHKTSKFKETTFNHEKDSKFKLEGPHEKVKCLACHFVKTHETKKLFVNYKPLDVECKSCHGTVVKEN